MTKQQQQVKEFHEAFKVLVNERPEIISMRDHALRVELIREELIEFKESGDLTAVADALGDLLYVVLGSAVTYGIDLEPVFNEIHRSNMTKLWTDEEVQAAKHCWPEGSHYVAHSITLNPAVGNSKTFRRHVVKRADGKVIKSPSYHPAKISL